VTGVPYSTSPVFSSLHKSFDRPSHCVSYYVSFPSEYSAEYSPMYRPCSEDLLPRHSSLYNECRVSTNNIKSVCGSACLWISLTFPIVLHVLHRGIPDGTLRQHSLISTKRPIRPTECTVVHFRASNWTDTVSECPR